MTKKRKLPIDVELVFDLKVLGHRIASGKFSWKYNASVEEIPPQQQLPRQEEA